MKCKEAMELIKNEFIFYSHCSAGEEILKEARDMTNVGVKIHTFDIDTGWKGIDTFVTMEIDRVLEEFFSVCPDAYLMPRITNYNPSNEWLRAYPSEIFVTMHGDGIAPEELREMVGTEKQSLIGGFRNGECIALQSFASAVWKKDALAMLRRLIQYLENSPYADRIIGYHVGYGKFGETHFWGAGLDHSLINKKRFFEFGLKKYGSADALAKAWEVNNVSPTEVPLPTIGNVEGKSENLQEFFNVGKQAHADYFEYLSHLSYSLAHDFSQCVKEITDKVVGLFHGYYMWGDPQIHGHLDQKWVLEDPIIDFVSAPKAYYRSGFGEPGGSHGIPNSVNRKKLWVDENDTRTHVEMLRNPDAVFMWGGGAENAEESKWVMWREFARNEMSGSAFWWMDIGGLWYADPELIAEMKKIYEVKQQIRRVKHESIAEILVVIDDNAFLHARIGRIFNGRANLDTIAEVASSGAPYDIYMLSDLNEIELSRYKLVVFLNPVDITSKQFQAYKFAPGTRFLWNYIPGGNGKAAEEITGIRMRETGKADVFPYLEIVSEEDLEVLETYKDPVKDLGIGLGYSREEVKNGASDLLNLPEDGIRTATKGVHTICAVPAPRKELIRKLGEEAGCRFYAPIGQYVYGDNRFMAIFYDGGYKLEVY